MSITHAHQCYFELAATSGRSKSKQHTFLLMIFRYLTRNVTFLSSKTTQIIFLELMPVCGN